ncbi:ANTAR domain-containing protein [Arthrobacter sp. RIT-PI-e]|uniref:ANTAR domain-containing protein n=1 Tax=Arthrobacter sp. RIT-PI-e TaxID=1681197 RepID=UPI000B1E8BA0|nr:ANTAR domain-containing protein [Arthrobacter sp. RIT-PI-e]
MTEHRAAQPSGPAAGLLRAVFDATDTPLVLMDPELMILAVNAGFVRSTGVPAARLVGRHAFEAFPENPEQLPERPADTVRQSLERVLRTGQRDTMFIQRYDIPDPERPGKYSVRYWSPVNSPVFDDDGELVGVLHEVMDVTEQREDLMSLFAVIDADAVEGGPERARRFTEYAATAMAHSNLYHSAQKEVKQLQEALGSRAVIDQAKGIIMAQQRCSSDEAFARLTRLSNDTNVRIRDVASALIYQAGAPAGRAADPLPDVVSENTPS